MSDNEKLAEEMIHKMVELIRERPETREDYLKPHPDRKIQIITEIALIKAAGPELLHP